MEKRQTFDFWSLRRPKELSDCGRSSPAFESLGRQFEPARTERTSSSGLAEAGESQNCLSRKRGRKTIKRGLRVSRPLVLEKNGGEFLFHSHFFALSLAPVVSLSPGSHLVRARSLFLSFLPSLVRTQHPHLRAAACFRKAISKVVPEEGASRQTIALASAFERSSNRSQGILLSLSLTPFPSPPPLSLHALSLHKQTPTACSAPSSRPWPPLRAPPSLPRARGWRRRRRQSSSLADSRPLCLRRLAPRSRAAPPLAPCPPRSARTPLTLPW